MISIAMRIKRILVNKSRSDEYVINLSSEVEYSALENRIKDSADEITEEDDISYIHNGMFGSSSKSHIIQDKDVVILLNQRNSKFTYIFPVPKKLKKILKEYNAKPTCSSILYFYRDGTYGSKDL
jgi:hypothetical protein